MEQILVSRYWNTGLSLATSFLSPESEDAKRDKIGRMGCSSSQPLNDSSIVVVESATPLKKALGYDRTARRQRQLALITTEDDEVLAKIFKDMDLNGDGVVRFDEFATVITKKLKLDLDTDELQRVWKRMGPEGRHDSIGEHDAVSFEQFRIGMKDVALLRVLVGMAGNGVGSFTPADNYNFRKSSNAAYASDSQQFYGKYQDIRAARDYTYHTNYTRERQLWQDQIIDSVVARSEPQLYPWVKP